MGLRKIPLEEYRKRMDSFTAEEFNPREIAALAKRIGMKYITITTRHHDGFSLYDTKGLNDYDAPHSAAKRDLIKEFVEACREYDLIPAFYHTTLDWSRNDFEEDFPAYLEYLRKSVELLCKNYGKIGGFWFDGNWSKPAGTDWQESELYSMIRSYQPDAMIINNTGLDARGKAGHPELDSVTFEQGVPYLLNRENAPKYLAAEMCQTLNNHWGVGTFDLDYKPVGELIETLCSCRKVGANYLLNIGPEAQGKIPEMQKAILETLGIWAKMAEEILYDGEVTAVQSQNQDFALKKGNSLYFFIHRLPIIGDGNVTISAERGLMRVFSGCTQPIRSIRWLDEEQELSFVQDEKTGMLCLNASGYPYGKQLVVRIAKAELK